MRISIGKETNTWQSVKNIVSYTSSIVLFATSWWLNVEKFHNEDIEKFLQASIVILMPIEVEWRLMLYPQLPGLCKTTICSFFVAKWLPSLCHSMAASCTTVIFTPVLAEWRLLLTHSLASTVELWSLLLTCNVEAKWTTHPEGFGITLTQTGVGTSFQHSLSDYLSWRNFESHTHPERLVADLHHTKDEASLQNSLYFYPCNFPQFSTGFGAF